MEGLSILENLARLVGADSIFFYDIGVFCLQQIVSQMNVVVVEELLLSLKWNMKK